MKTLSRTFYAFFSANCTNEIVVKQAYKKLKTVEPATANFLCRYSTAKIIQQMHDIFMAKDIYIITHDVSVYNLLMCMDKKNDPVAEKYYLYEENKADIDAGKKPLPGYVKSAIFYSWVSTLENLMRENQTPAEKYNSDLQIYLNIVEWFKSFDWNSFFKNGLNIYGIRIR